MSLQEKQMQLEAAKLRADREARGLREKELAHQLQLKQLELEEHDRERQLHLKQMELEERDRERQFERERQERDLELKRLELELASKSVLSVESQTPVFDVSRHIRLVPPFSEDEVEKYFSHFERVATTLQWPKVVWTLLLQCVLVGKAQEVYSSLSLQQSSDYDVVKTSILNAYELVPEAYRQRFRKSRKGSCKVAVRPELPMQGIDFILGNDLAGGKVLPLPEVIDNPAVPPSSVVPGYESVFPACAVTRAQARRPSTDELCDTFMAVSDPLVSRAAPSDGGVVEGAPRTRAVNGHDDETMSLPVSKTLISQEQRKDSTLTQCRSAVVDKANITANSVAFFQYIKWWFLLNFGLRCCV
ncbi:uncharacterized protein LOC114780060 isoform X2 [Denticeps clupeoides]|uniref:uncharacterized protein LOC114780060 isoform X2 n=1 Tax=Denticeps clupeoides TaxID=299321 RepID=UPI0010A38A52|nr:uncharacterized protein LOC114780060 isoform X2 [Denticeps clupeoides]